MIPEIEEHTPAYSLHIIADWFNTFKEYEYRPICDNFSWSSCTSYLPPDSGAEFDADL